MTDTKTCIICGLDKPLSAYYHRSDHKDRLYKECIPCINRIRREQAAARTAARSGDVRYCLACRCELDKPATNQVYCETCADERAKYQCSIWHRDNKGKLKRIDRSNPCETCAYEATCRTRIHDMFYELPCFRCSPLHAEFTQQIRVRLEQPVAMDIQGIRD
jgi:hypothetical protein